MIVQPDEAIIASIQCRQAYLSVPIAYVRIASFISGDGLERVIDTPGSVLARAAHSESALRSVAAGLNNHLMVQGFAKLTFSSDSPVIDAIVQCLLLNYRQVFEVQGAEPGSGSARVAVRNAKHEFVGPSSLPLHSSSIGVNIGQTYTKAVVLSEAGQVPQQRVRMETFRPGERSAETLVRAIFDLITRLGKQADTYGSIGLCVGGLVFGGEISKNSGITSGLSDRDADLITNLPGEIERAFRRPVFVYQDVRAKAYYHSSYFPGRRVLILDLGTSVGAALVDADGSVVPGYNQVGRMAVDIGPSARARTDGGARGVLSQYLSARGVCQSLREWSIPCPSTAALESLEISSTNSVELISEIATLLDAAVEMLAPQLNMQVVLLTGGLANMPETREAMARVQSHSLNIDFYVSQEPIYDGALGAALAARTIGRASEGQVQHGPS